MEDDEIGDSYTEFLEEELADSWDTIKAVQDFLIDFVEILDFMKDSDSPGSPIQIPSQVNQDIFEGLVSKCTASLEDFQERRGKLINLD